MPESLPDFVTKSNLRSYNENIKLLGTKFNRLTLTDVVGIVSSLFVGEFTCDCGNVIQKNLTSVRKEYVKSCGCLQKDAVKALAKHKMTGIEIYRRWASIKARCKDTDDPTYGGKGITYGPSWEDFTVFYADMGDGFSPELEIDRIDVTKGYSKENCRWTDHSENNYNKNKQSNNLSGKTGVSWHAGTNKYRAYITKAGKQTHLGLYSKIEDAVTAREVAEIELYGYGRP